MHLNFNINFTICGLLIIGIVFLVLRAMYDFRRRSTRKFALFVNVAFISGILDLVTAFTISNPEKIPVWLNTLLVSIYIVTAYSSAWLIGSYIKCCIRYNSKPHVIADHIVGFGYMVILIINAYTGIIFDFAGGTYNRGPLFPMNFLIPLYFVIHNSLILIYKRKNFDKKQRVVNATIIVFPLTAAVLQLIFPEYLLTFLSCALFSLVLLFDLETPDFIELDYLRKNLINEVNKKTNVLRMREQQIDLMSQEATQALAQAIDEKDEYTNGHSARVSVYSMLLAQALNWDLDKVEAVRIAALLHDVGKIGIPDSILKNPNKLSDSEYSEIKTHTNRGAKILHNLTTLPNAVIVAKYHHERFDGKGYPGDFAGKEIPDFARIVSIADAYDAMNSKRVYRKNLPQEEVIKRLKEGSGTQFDPDYLKVFLNLIKDGLVY